MMANELRDEFVHDAMFCDTTVTKVWPRVLCLVIKVRAAYCGIQHGCNLETFLTIGIGAGLEAFFQL